VNSAFSRSSLATVGLVAALMVFAGCQKKEETMSTTEDSTRTETQGQTATPAPSATTPAPIDTLPAGHIEVQHVLIGFVSSVPQKNITRSRAEAETLANDILKRARAGEDFGQLVQKYTDDAYPGIYHLADRGVQVDQAGGEIARDGFVKGFSDAAFSLKQGDVGIATYNPKDSPFGWHIIKRLR
jgi:hypothetical protein